jgi:hypothetical protein
MALLAGCEASVPPVITPPPSTPRSVPTLEGTRALGVAVSVGSPTPTPVLVGDYPTLVRDRLIGIETALKQLDQQFAVLRTSPALIVERDWRTETLKRVDDVGAAAALLKALGARSGPDAFLYSEVSKVLSDLDFVVSEYRMAFDFDPDGSHFSRAGRAEKMTFDEVESMLLGLRRGIGAAPTLTPTPTS